jgi:G3E family GTPase
MTDRERIAFHVVTGFLGAGKTTLINRLLRAPELVDALVVVNEWGDIGLDHLLYERLSSDAILINSGCVCCALRGDLLEALRYALVRRDSGALPPFGRIVLETTGLAEPAPILHALIADPALSSRLRLAGVTTLIDAVNGRATLSARPESARQVALADRLVIAKSDCLPAFERGERLAELRSALRTLNPMAPMLDGAAEEFGAAEFLAEPIVRGEIEPQERPGHAPGIRTFAFRSAELIDPGAFAQFLSLLGSMLGPKLLRLKGLIALSDRPDAPIQLDGVQHVFHPPRLLAGWPDADHETRIVIIVEGVAARDVESLWAALVRTPRIDSPDLAALSDNPLAPRAGGLLCLD